MTVSNEKKWVISAMSAVIFIILSSNESFEFTNRILEHNFCIQTIQKNKPTWQGLIIHGIVFMLITRFLMDKDYADDILNVMKKTDKKSTFSS